MFLFSFRGGQMAILDIITRLRNQAGAGAAELKGDLKGIEAAAQGADIKTAALEQRSRLLGQEMNKLAKEVAQSKISVSDAQAKYEAFEKTLVKVAEVTPKVEDGLKDVDEGSKKNALSFTELNQAMEIAKKGYDTIKQAAQQFYAILKEGAQIAAAENTFRNLAQSIDTTAAALGGTLRTATGGMVSDMDLMAGANRFVAMGLANTQEEAGKLANIATQLGVAFRGDAAVGMEELALLLANQSIPRLDSFGVSAGKVRERINELQAANQGMSRETAFMTAFMEQAQVTMGKIGDQSSTAAGRMAVLEANVNNLQTSFKSTFSTEFINGLNEFSNGLFETAEGSAAAGKNVGAFAADMILFGLHIKGAKDVVDESLGSYDNLVDVVRETKAEALAHTAALKCEHDAMVRSLTAIDDRRESIEAHSRALAADAIIASGHAAAIHATTPAYAEFKDKLIQSNSLLTEEESAFRQAQSAAAEANKALHERVAAEAAAAEATRKHEAAIAAERAMMAGFFNEAAKGGNELELFTNNLDQLGEQTYAVTNLTANQQAELDRLQGSYEKAAQTIRDYELGIKGANMTDEERNKKIAEQQAIMAAVQSSMQPLINAGTSIVETNNALTFSTDAVASSLFGMVGASDAGAFSIAAAGLALGQFTPQAAEAYLKTAILKIEMDKLAASFAETGNVNALVTGMQDAMASVEGLSMTINSADGSVHMIDESLGTATQSTQTMIDKFGEVPEEIATEMVLDSAAAVDSFITYKGYLDGIPDTVTTNVVTNYTNTGSTSPGTANASGGYQQMSTGGEVTGGTPGRDSVPAMLMPGERVLTPNQNQEWKQWKSGRDQSRGDMLANNLFGGGGSGSSSVVSNAAANGNVTIQIINYNQFSGPVSQDTLAKFESNQRRAIEQALDERDRRVSGMTRMRS